MTKEDGTEVVAKLPFSFAGPPKYLTASEAAVLQYLHDHTKVPVPALLAWNSDSTNPVGSEYIIMEKADGCQLATKWREMDDYGHIQLIKNLCKIEADLAAINIPVSGSLYFRASMEPSDRYEPLASEMDSPGRFCIGPSCERAWFGEGEPVSVQTSFDQGPWPNLPAFGIALADREIARVEQKPQAPVPWGPPRGSIEEQITLLKMAKRVFPKMSPQSQPGHVPWPTLWHSDLHMGNIYVSDKDPTRIASLIDWQSIVVAPLFYQVRFPRFIEMDEDYELGPEVPTLPEDIDQMDPDDQDTTRYKHKQTLMTKAYEAGSGLTNKNIYKALHLPHFSRQLFVRCGSDWEDGAVPLRACLIAIAETWNEAGFPGDCPLHFSEADIERHQQEFQEYRNYHDIHELAQRCLGTDADGWIHPDDDFEMKQQRNKELLKSFLDHCAEHGESAEEVRNVWPF